jgi:hypothetical protein
MSKDRKGHGSDKKGAMTPKTKKWRVAVRGDARIVTEKLQKQYNTADAWERRRAASAKDAKFDAKGKLIYGAGRKW